MKLSKKSNYVILHDEWDKYLKNPIAYPTYFSEDGLTIKEVYDRSLESLENMTKGQSEQLRKECLYTIGK